MEILREQWLWNREARAIWLWVFFFSGVILTAILYPSQGHTALAVGLLPPVACGAIIGAIYGYVGTRVQALKRSLAGEQGDMAEALIHIGGVQSPGIAIMKHRELYLVPLAGQRLTVALSDMESVRETGNLYGKGLLWKRVFLVKAPQNRRIGFAVAPSVADRWRTRLNLAGRHV